ncbi:[FeFe] hydrogenase, group A [Desulfotomaculum copahuensis]|uniref:Ferredoxin n=1 Tax=Desulfotomaculum copahuensis TaxID=1838280 RepID=A0A1B7LCX0_9FIRM|nr:[FeFe] hydrogenase, group A [Desulfotomaculum copahuensis]OAT80762.1 ferredoxin [Desulfotomaculum copahuensis]
MSTGNVSIDGRLVEINDCRNLLELIRLAGIELPTFCYHSELSIYGACRMCMVEVDGRGLTAACSTPPENGMVVHTNTARTRRLRRMIIELLLANHERECTSCERSGNCRLQQLAHQLGVTRVRFGGRDRRLPVDGSSPALVKNPNKCILCGDCVRMCKEIQGLGIWDFAFRGAKTQVTTAFDKPLAEVSCVNCGQCAAVCPTGALTVKPDVDRVWEAIYDPDKVVVVQVAPAVRVAIGEEFGLHPGEKATGQMVAALRRIGFDRVFDTLFTADMTTIEESLELLGRLDNGGRLPLFTSCCPAWVKYAEQFHAGLLENLSTCRSPQQMFGSLIKKHYARETGLESGKMVCVSVMPCTAKKFEAIRPEFVTAESPDVDIVLTTVELAKMIKEAGIVFNELEPQTFDNPLGMGSGAAVIYGASGGVMESVVRFVSFHLDGAGQGRVDFYPARGMQGIKEAELAIGGQTLKLAVVNGLGNAEKLIRRLEAGEIFYHAVEIMACPGGCLGGGGQPVPNDTTVRRERMKGIYSLDRAEQLHRPQDNVFVTRALERWFGGPANRNTHRDLHTHYYPRRRISGKPVDVSGEPEQQPLEVAVCVGTNCYLKGSYDVLNKFAELARQMGIMDYLRLKGTFCLEHCDCGVSVKVGEEIITGVDPENVEELFRARVAARVPTPR